MSAGHLDAARQQPTFALVKALMLLGLLGGLAFLPLTPVSAAPKAEPCASACCKSEATCGAPACICPIAFVVPSTSVATLADQTAPFDFSRHPLTVLLAGDLFAPARTEQPPVPPPRA